LAVQGKPVRHLAPLIQAVHEGDRNPPCKPSPLLTQSRTDGFHAAFAQAQREAATDAALYRAMRNWLDDYDARTRIEWHGFCIRPYAAEDETQIIELWNRCGLVVPWNDPRRDIERKRMVNPELFLVGVLGERIVATVMVGYEGHRGWINYLAVAPECQRSGFGRRIMEAAEALLRERGCPKINLQVRTSNQAVIAFYESLGFSVDAVISMGKRLAP
jgi:ribosomal protein S18 acetylase RimI-like enzyme